MGKGFTGAHRKKRSVWHEIGGLAAKKNRDLVPFIVEGAATGSKERSGSVATGSGGGRHRIKATKCERLLGDRLVVAATVPRKLNARPVENFEREELSGTLQNA